ncbi:hypothetical protein Egran_00660 [Elaphomyces granulatus]|uniref:Uncharacterized protein n=1 Tax=Elaphomyces granulatus TaxID=519963 RepID=A0A232M5B9_9EURO|nr:hypothetical protein Egran_00660 [Elaphomyces granulatus]
MILSRRSWSLFSSASFLFFLFILFQKASQREQWRQIPQPVGMSEVSMPGLSTTALSSWTISPERINTSKTKSPSIPRPSLATGVRKPSGSKYSKTVVVAQKKTEDTYWINRNLDWDFAVYIADDPTAPLHPPKNKGNEVMVYLTYIIDYYEKLPDIVAFMHFHQDSWHNEEVLNSDSVQMLNRLSPERVIREGYMNMRCIWAPGCPDWMHPRQAKVDEYKQEETVIIQSWSELFPDDPIPDVLAQPCCSQFAVSREQILATPLSRYFLYRDWLLRTELSDYISGRVWEYLWQVIFTGKHVFCPKTHVCLCDGFGICFGGEKEADAYFDLRHEVRRLEDDLEKLEEEADRVDQIINEGSEALETLEMPDENVIEELMGKLDTKTRRLMQMKSEALSRGMQPKNRALEAGRPWKEGDGF